MLAHVRFVSAALAVCAASLSLAAGASAAPGKEAPVAPTTPQTRFVPDNVIVVFDRDADGGDRAQTRGDADVSLERTLGRSDFQLVQVQDGQSVGGALSKLRADPDVRVAARDAYDTPSAVPNDPQFGSLWGLRNLGIAPGVQGFPNPLVGADIKAVAAWDRTTGAPSAVMADIDSGYRFNNEDLAGVTWSNNDPAGGGDQDANGFVDDIRGWDFVGPNNDNTSYAGDNDPTDDDLSSGGHGVHVAGTMGAAGNNAKGITGVSQNARIMPLRVCSPSPMFNAVNCRQSAQIAAINYAGANGARAANMSLGGTNFSQAVVTAFASNPQTLFLIAAGNDGVNNNSLHHYPCDYNPTTDPSPAVPGAVDNIVCVAATNQADALAGFSNYSSTSVDLAAPGTEVLSTFSRGPFFTEDFQGSGFSSWTPTGADGGFGRINEPPLTSFGITDTPGAPAVASTVRASTSPDIAIPAGTGDCVFTQTREVRAGGTYTYDILRNGTSVFAVSPTSSGRIATAPIPDLAGTNVQIRVTYSTGASPTATTGVWLDDLDISCYLPTTATGGYAYLQGTSMATPHVTGAAGLLFSLKPAASVTEVRNALLSSVDPRGSLSGKTVTGGRLNVSRALNTLVPGGAAGSGAAAGSGITAGGASASTVAPSGGSGSSSGPLVTFSLAGLPGSLQLDTSASGTVTVTGTPGTAGILSVKTAKPVIAARKKKAKKKVLALAQKRFSVPASGKAKVKFKVSGKALRTLKKAKRLSAKVEVTSGPRTVSRTLTLKAPKAKKKKRKR